MSLKSNVFVNNNFLLRLILILHLIYCFVIVLLFAVISERDSQVTKKLRDVVDKQRDEIRAKDHELARRNEDVEAVRF